MSAIIFVPIAVDYIECSEMYYMWYKMEILNLLSGKY